MATQPFSAARELPATAELLRVEDLSVRFSDGHRQLHAVDQVSFTLSRGRTLGIVGESGCGKSTLSRAILRLIEPSAGRVVFDGIELHTLSREELRRLRPRMQLIFQDPAGSLNARLTVEQIVGEALSVHARVANRRQRRAVVEEALEAVGLGPDALDRRPDEFSGGQRQRIGIARALVLSPDLLVCDEPVSALDVSIQSQILNLLSDLQAARGLTYLFIAHNLAVVRHFCDEVAVMYLGRIVEQAPAAELFREPAHPYTRALLAAIPRPVPGGRSLPPADQAEPPDPRNPPPGCHFHPRCPIAQERCRREQPALLQHGSRSPVHRAACHFAGQT